MASALFRIPVIFLLICFSSLLIKAFAEIALAYSTASGSRYKLYSNLAAEKGLSGCLSKNLCTYFLLMVVIIFHNLLQQWQITTSFLYSLVIAIQFFISYYKVVVFIDPLQGLYAISIITILYLFYRYGYDI